RGRAAAPGTPAAVPLTPARPAPVAARAAALPGPLPGPPRGLVVEPQGERDPLARQVDVEHLDPHDVAGFDHLARVLDEPVRHRRHVDQAVLVDADVDERAERG